MSVCAIIFDLGDTLVHWPDWDTAAEQRWGEAYDFVCGAQPNGALQERLPFVRAMRAS